MLEWMQERAKFFLWKTIFSPLEWKSLNCVNTLEKKSDVCWIWYEKKTKSQKNVIELTKLYFFPLGLISLQKKKKNRRKLFMSMENYVSILLYSFIKRDYLFWKVGFDVRASGSHVYVMRFPTLKQISILIFYVIKMVYNWKWKKEKIRRTTTTAKRNVCVT